MDDQALVEAVRAGDTEAFGALYDRWYDRVFHLARRITRDDGLAADVAQDAFLTAWRRLPELRDVPSFGGWLLRIARNRALDLVRSAERTRTTMTDTVEETGAADRLVDLDDPAVVAGDRELQALVLGAAEALGERDATALDLQLRYGLEPAEVGEVLGINRNAANQLVHRMKGRLEKALRSRVLWRGGEPECAGLRNALLEADVGGFDQQAVSVTERHAATCEDCGRRQALRLDPAKLFAAVPVAAAPILFKQRAAAALEAEGVPMSGSTFRKRRRQWVRTAVMAGVGVVIFVIAAAVTTAELGDGGLGPPVEQLPVNEVTTTTADGTFTAVIPDPPEPQAVRPADDGEPASAPPSGDVPPPAAPPVPITPTTGTISTSGSAPTVSPAGQWPTVTWSTGGADAASVSGPGLASSALSGSQQVCPGSVVTGACRSAPGTYTYVLTASGPGGEVQRQATITVA